MFGWGGGMTGEFPLHRFQEYGGLNDAELRAVAALADEPRRYTRNQVIRSEGCAGDGFFLLFDGWAAASVSLPDGGRQILKVHLPGDALGTPSMSVALTAETLTALTPALVGSVSFKRFGRLLEAHPRVAAFFLLSVQRERVALMDQLASMGRTSAECRLAALLVDLMERLEPLGLVEDERFTACLTQDEMGDVLGLTGVHINRTMRELEHRRLIERRRHHIMVLDRPGLVRLAARPQRDLRTDLGWLPAARAD